MKHRITQSAAIACVAALLSACSSINLDALSFGGIKEQDTSRPPAGATAYQCENSRHFFVRYVDNGAAAWVMLPDREFRLNKTGSGNSYSNGSDRLELKDKEATLWDGATAAYAGCKAAGG